MFFFFVKVFSFEKMGEGGKGEKKVLFNTNVSGIEGKKVEERKEKRERETFPREFCLRESRLV